MTSSPESRRGGLGYAALCDLVRARVARGELRPGERLKTVREWAAELGVNVNTVARAYATLAHDGVVVTQPGGGTRVASVPDGALSRHARAARLDEIVGGAALQALGLGYRPEQVEAALVGQLARWRSLQTQEQQALVTAEESLLFVGSHDLTLELLAARLQHRQPAVQMQVRYAGSLEGLMALARDEAHLAGCHLLDEQTGEYNAPFVARLLPGQPVLLVTLALREQGLLLAPGNPTRVRALGDLARPDVRVAQRQRGSGTRVLLEQALRHAGIAPEALRGSEPPYATHLAVAGAVAGGAADVGLGIRGAARAYGLEFLPLASERYELAIPARRLPEPALQALLAVLADDDFRRAVGELGGYDVSETGSRRLVE